MRLSDLLSKPITEEFVQVEGFLKNQTLGLGKQRKIRIGNIALNFYCEKCNDDRTFLSQNDLFCIGVSDHLVSIDCVLKCPCCDSTVQTWFLVECNYDIAAQAPEVRVVKRSEKLSDMVAISKDLYGSYSEWLYKAQRAFRDGLGAGSIVYLRKTFEKITVKSAEAHGIPLTTSKGRRKKFSVLLKDVDEQCSIVPKEFSNHSYRLFQELSDVMHGDYNESLGLQKYEEFHRLIIGIIENVKNSNEYMSAVRTLGWDDGGNEA